MTADLTPNELMALRAYAQGRRADLKATELGAARVRLAAAGLVRDCNHRTNPMYVTPTPAGRRLLAELDRDALAPMTAAAADWIYTEVLTQRFLESSGAIMWTGAREKRRDEGQGAAFLRRCACQYGPCGYCADGKHGRCTHRDRSPATSPETYVQNRRGMAVADVWLSGKPCCWRCPCDCPAPEPVSAPVAVPMVVFEQLDLFALAGGAP